jgi:hypothetical protein
MGRGDHDVVMQTADNDVSGLLPRTGALKEFGLGHDRGMALGQ